MKNVRWGSDGGVMWVFSTVLQTAPGKSLKEDFDCNVLSLHN